MMATVDLQVVNLAIRRALAEAQAAEDGSEVHERAHAALDRLCARRDALEAQTERTVRT